MNKIKDFLQSENIRKILISFGIVYPILMMIIYFVLGMIRPDYNPLTQTISELGVIGTSTALLASICFIINGLMIILFALGLYFTLKEQKGALIGPLLMILDGIFDWMGSGIFPVDETLIPVTFSGMIHLIVSVIGLGMMILAPFFIARSLKENESELYKLTLIFGIIIIITNSLFLAFTFFNILIGLFQRIAIGIYSAWIFILAVIYFKTKNY